MPTAQERHAQIIGYIPPTPGGLGGVQALNAANTWLAYSFIPPETKTLNAVKVYCSANNGTLANIGVSCDLYSDNAGYPNASLQSVNIPIGSWVAANNWVEFTGLSTSVTGGTVYWLVFKNISVAPATDYPTLRFQQNALNSILCFTLAYNYPWGKRVSTDGGGSWGTLGTGIAGFRLQYSDGSYDGFPISNVQGGVTLVYAAREHGVVFTTPLNARLNVRGIGMWASKQGTPTGQLRYRIYNGVTLVATTASIPAASVNTTLSWIILYFSSTQIIEPGTTLRVVMSETTQSDASAKAFFHVDFTIEDDANSRALMPFNGLQKTLTTDSTANPVVFTDTNTVISPFALILDTDGEFAAQAAGGGGTARGIFTGGRL